ncbi:hypothetical protein Bca101_019797 [Brassica carinata]
MTKKVLMFLTSLIVLCVLISSIDAKPKYINYPEQPNKGKPDRSCLQSDKCRGGTDSRPPLKQFLQKFLKEILGCTETSSTVRFPFRNRN